MNSVQMTPSKLQGQHKFCLTDKTKALLQALHSKSDKVLRLRGAKQRLLICSSVNLSGPAASVVECVTELSQQEKQLRNEVQSGIEQLRQRGPGGEPMEHELSKELSKIEAKLNPRPTGVCSIL